MNRSTFISGVPTNLQQQCSTFQDIPMFGYGDAPVPHGVSANRFSIPPHHASMSNAASSLNTSTGPSSSSGRRRREVDSSESEFSLNIDRVVQGLDRRTTLMIRNIPNKYSQTAVLEEINEHFIGSYDFFYLPIDFKNKCNVGYAFINFCEYRSIVPFFCKYNGRRWNNFNSEKVCAISYARIQV